MGVWARYPSTIAKNVDGTKKYLLCSARISGRPCFRQWAVESWSVSPRSYTDPHCSRDLTWPRDFISKHSNCPHMLQDSLAARLRSPQSWCSHPQNKVRAKSTSQPLRVQRKKDRSLFWANFDRANEYPGVVELTFSKLFPDPKNINYRRS